MLLQVQYVTFKAVKKLAVGAVCALAGLRNNNKTPITKTHARTQPRAPMPRRRWRKTS